MVDFRLEPAKDLGLTHRQRTLSLNREAGLIETGLHMGWWGFMRTYLRLYHRMRVEGRSHLPAKPPFVLIANHASHLDALAMAAPLPWRHRDCIFPLAAGDVFFETPVLATFAMACINALPVWRNNCGRHALGELRKRLVEQPCIYILFPEGRRSEDGSLLEFKAGLGMMVAETGVPVVPCWLGGAHEAWARDAIVPRPRKIVMRIGEPLDFAGIRNRREGWSKIADRARAAVVALAGDQSEGASRITGR
ncbi:MAG: lysophospholipid acyltransferase family protein [Phycisphaeraceae bacterium]